MLLQLVLWLQCEAVRGFTTRGFANNGALRTHASRSVHAAIGREPEIQNIRARGMTQLLVAARNRWRKKGFLSNLARDYEIYRREYGLGIARPYTIRGHSILHTRDSNDTLGDEDFAAVRSAVRHR